MLDGNHNYKKHHYFNFFAMKISDGFLEISRDFMVWMSNEKAHILHSIIRSEGTLLHSSICEKAFKTEWMVYMSFQHLSLKFGKKETAQILACRRR